MALITETRLRALLARGIPNPFPLAEEDKMTPAAADFLRSRGIGVLRTRGGPTFLQSKNSTGTGTGCTEKTAGSSSLLDEQPFLPVNGRFSVPVGVSNRHVHLSQEHVELLFGPGYRLTPLRELSQKGQFAAKETVTLVGSKGTIPQVRILGPSRGASQVEVSRTDGFTLGVHPPVRLSGDLSGTPGIAVVGPKQTITLTEGLIVAKSHIHMSVEEAERCQVAHGDRLIVEAMTDRPLLFPDVVARVSAHYMLDFHIDTDEANAAQLKTGDRVRVLGKTSGGKE